MMEGFRDLKCGVCWNEYSDDHCPRNLPCGHTICGHCIDGCISSQRKTCPVCRKRFRATSASDLAVNIVAINVAKQFSSMRAQTNASCRDSGGLLKEVINNFKKKIVLAIPDIQDVEKEIVCLLEYSDSLKEDANKSRDKVQQLLEKINKNAETWRKSLPGIRQKKEKLEDICASLDGANNYAMAGSLIDEAEGVLKDVQGSIKLHEDLLQNYEAERQNTKQVILNTKENISEIADQMIKGIEDYPKFIAKEKDFKDLLEILKRNPQREITLGLNLQESQRIATLKTESNNRVSLSHFKEGSLPPRSFVTEMDSLFAKAPRRAFLDLGVERMFLGRVIINVIDDSNYALNFLHMCAGDLGPSYANSAIIEVIEKGEDKERIVFGTYKTAGGNSSKAVISGVDWKREWNRDIHRKNTLKAGQVIGWNALPHFTSVFKIVIGHNPVWNNDRIYGIVEEGLGVLRDIILHYPNISDVTIIESGLIFSL